MTDQDIELELEIVALQAHIDQLAAEFEDASTTIARRAEIYADCRALYDELLAIVLEGENR